MHHPAHSTHTHTSNTPTGGYLSLSCCNSPTPPILWVGSGGWLPLLLPVPEEVYDRLATVQPDPAYMHPATPFKSCKSGSAVWPNQPVNLGGPFKILKKSSCALAQRTGAKQVVKPEDVKAHTSPVPGQNLVQSAGVLGSRGLACHSSTLCTVASSVWGRQCRTRLTQSG